MKFKNKRKESFKEWFAQATTLNDRILSAFIGAWAGMWIGSLGRIIYETPVSITVVGIFAIGGAIVCLLTGAVIPKYSRIIFFPFAFMGMGSN